MEHGIYLTDLYQIEAIEDEWFEGQPLDIVSTTFSAGIADQGTQAITFDAPRANVSQDEALRRAFGGDEGRRLLIAYEFAGANRGDYRPAATGQFDDRYRTFARQLVDLGMGDSIIAPNHEFNLSWSSKYPDDPANYRDGFAHVVREMQSVDGADFTFCFAPARNRLGIAPEAWPLQSDYWPEGEPAPVVTPSFYDASNPIYPDDASAASDERLERLRDKAWNEKHKPTLDMWRDFADERGADMGLREWGCASDAWTNNGGLDNPEFIRRMFDYMDEHDFRFQTYWNGESPKHRIWPPSESRLPNAGRAWREEVIADRSSESTPEPTATPTAEPTATPTRTPDEASDTDGQYGGYATPERGQADWHEPLNENFRAVARDIESLAARIDELEDE